MEKRATDEVYRLKRRDQETQDDECGVQSEARGLPWYGYVHESLPMGTGLSISVGGRSRTPLALLHKTNPGPF